MVPTQYELTTAVDDLCREKPIWVAELNSGQMVFQDDYRPGVSEHSAWIRLGKYVKETGDFIARLRIQFCSNMVWVEQSDLGYYFSKGCGVFLAQSQVSIDFYSVGHMVSEDIIIVKQFKTPEMLYMTDVRRTVEESGDRLIKNPQKN